MSFIKLFIKAVSLVSGNVNTVTAANIVPNVQRYSATVIIGNILGGVTTIPAQNFTNDGGTSVPIGGLTVATSNGYFNVFVNGILQRGGLCTLTSTSLVINTALVLGVVVSLEVINFTSVATSTSTNNISVNTQIIS
jgi:hypothetical protein